MDAAELLAAKQLREETVVVNMGGDGSTADIRIRALPRKQYRELLEDNPPAEDDTEAEWNPDTFPPALIAASCIDPVFTLEQAQQLWDEWEAAEAAPLFLACWSVNERRGRLGFTWPGSAQTSGSGQNSTTASRGESRTRSSSTGRKTTKTKP